MTNTLLRYAYKNELQNNPNPILKRGGKVYSQNEEDGITFEILRRINIEQGVFGEFGVGNGLENNTIALAARGWPGFWVGGEDLAINITYNGVTNFVYNKVWITKDNIVQHYIDGLSRINKSECDVISLDLDGNDYYFIEALLSSGIRPSVFIAEYNAKFIPPIEFVIDYDDNHRWACDDYFGASLTSLVKLFNKYNYFLVCCNITGSNAFFVRNDHRVHFNDVMQDTMSLYASPKYFLGGMDVSGHPASKRTIERIFARLNTPVTQNTV